MKKKILSAFSLVELMVTLIVVSCITAALAPVITKKLKSRDISVSSGGNSNVTFTTCSQELEDKGCVFCANENRCSLCSRACESDEYVNTPDCTCLPCANKGENCVQCNQKACTKCASGFGFNSVTKQCQKCATNQFSDGFSPCETCTEMYICNGANRTPCPSGQYAPSGATACLPCENILANCGTCDPRECINCKKGYKFKTKNGAKTCILAFGQQVFDTVGSHNFTVPEGVEVINVLLVGGGAGGGGGAIASATVNFSSTQDWTIPEAVRGKKVKVTACGGGGGGGNAYKGGNGGSFKDREIPMPNEEKIKIHIGKGGRAGGGGSAGAGGNASGSAGKAGTGPACGKLGYDPIYNSTSAAGGAGGGGQKGHTCWWGLCPNGGAGNYVGGGGGGLSGHSSCDGVDNNGNTNANGGGGGGGATLFYHSAYANVKDYVASGGGGGGGGANEGGGGGGGGGVGGGKGGANTAAGSNGYNSGKSGFSAPYCVGGAKKNAGGNGYMRITYTAATNGGTGGGAGMIARGKINVSEGQLLSVVVGAGGAGGAANNAGASGGASYITRSGEVLIKTLGSNSTGGQSNGTTVGTKGSVTNGVSSAAANINYSVVNPDNGAVTNYTFSNTSGSAASGATGGAGGKTVIYSSETHCSAGSGGALNNAGIAASGAGGCGGGGGGAGASGGAGSGGYVKLIWGEEFN